MMTMIIFRIIVLLPTILIYGYGSKMTINGAFISRPNSCKLSCGVHNFQRWKEEHTSVVNVPRFLTPTGDDSFTDDEEEEDDDVEYKPASNNVLGTQLKSCCCNVRGTGIGTGFYRNGFCSTGDQDLGRHTVCVQVTNDFLQFSARVGNDLSTPMPEYNFPGLKEGDRWCLCAARWVQAYQAGKAPMLVLEASHEKSLSYAPLNILQEYGIDKEEAASVLERLNQQREQLKKML